MQPAYEEDDDSQNSKQFSFPGGCPLVAKAEALGGLPLDAAKDHKGPGRLISHWGQRSALGVTGLGTTLSKV